MKIILDGMGGDYAPRSIVEGAALALKEFADLEIVLTGDPALLLPVLQETQADMSRIDMIEALQTIQMSDSPVHAVREKPDSSMMRALKLLSENRNAMMISAGNTGALVAGATLIVRRIKGVKRPALAPVLPTRQGAVLLIDGGANAECKPAYLAQFGIMGSIYMNKVFGIREPRVVLINNGSEDGKGSHLTKEAYKMLMKSPIRFLGNVEARDLLSGKYDVLVTDGFTGNVVLKFVEGCSRTILDMLKEYIRESFGAKIGALFMKNAFNKLRKKMDYKEYGGALLLGVNGGVMKAHGSSDGKAIFAAIRAARSFVDQDVVGEITSEMGKITAQIEKEKAAKALSKEATIIAADEKGTAGPKASAADTKGSSAKSSSAKSSSAKRSSSKGTSAAAAPGAARKGVAAKKQPDKKRTGAGQAPKKAPKAGGNNAH